MKALFILLVFISSPVFAQDTYTVIKVMGNVVSQRLNRTLVTGDKVQSKDALKFGSKGDYVILHGPKSGRKMIKGVPDSSPREFIQLLQSFVKTSSKSAATRGAGEGYISKLSEMLNVDTLLILGNGRIGVDTVKLPLAKPAGVRVIYKGEKSMVVRTISERGSFFIGRKNMFGDHAPIPLPRVSIQYFENEAEDYAFASGQYLGEFVPKFSDEGQLKTEIAILLAVIDQRSRTQAELTDEVQSYLEQAYGPTVRGNLTDWLLQNNLIR